jgi:hypothetical protein
MKLSSCVIGKPATKLQTRPDVPRSASKARAAIETVNEWLDGHALSDELLEDGCGHYLIANAENGTQSSVVFL